MATDSALINGNDFLAVLGLGIKTEGVKTLFKGYGLRSPKGESEDFCDDTIVWYSKQSMRIDIYRGKKFRAITGQAVSDEDDWYVGQVEFMAVGADDRMKSTFAGVLPGGLQMTSVPRDFLQCFGQANIDTLLEWPGYRGRLLAWRHERLNTAISFLSAEPNSGVLSFTASVIGCQETWALTWPEVFSVRGAVARRIASRKGRDS